VLEARQRRAFRRLPYLSTRQLIRAYVSIRQQTLLLLYTTTATANAHTRLSLIALYHWQVLFCISMVFHLIKSKARYKMQRFKTGKRVFLSNAKQENAKQSVLRKQTQTSFSPVLFYRVRA
jgi:FlaA1/EpsC-like NDP-sugar epimerase